MAVLRIFHPRHQRQWACGGLAAQTRQRFPRRVGGEFKSIPCPELGASCRWVGVIPLPEIVRGGHLPDPFVDGRLLFADAARPESIHQDPATVLGGGRVVHTPDPVPRLLCHRSITVDRMADTQDLEALSTKDLHDRAVKLAVRHGDVKFLWELLKSIPAAEAAAGDIGESEADIKYVLPMLDDYVHAGEGEIGEVLRPMYIDYLSKRS